MKDNDIVMCQCCGDNVFYEDTIKSKKGLICKNCDNPMRYRFYVEKEDLTQEEE